MPETTDGTARAAEERPAPPRNAGGASENAPLAPEPGVKSAAREAAIKTLRAVQTLCATSADRLENAAARPSLPRRPEDAPRNDRQPPPERPDRQPRKDAAPRPDQEPQTPATASGAERSWHAEAETPSPRPRTVRQDKAETPGARGGQAKPENGRRSQLAASVTGKREIIRTRSSIHVRRTFPYAGVVLALIAAGALVFSGVTLLRVLRGHFAGPDAPSARVPVVRAAPGGSNGVVRVVRPGAPERKAPAPQDKKPPQSPSPAAPPSERATITFGGEKNIDAVNVRDGHATQGTNVIGRLAPGSVKLLEVWTGRNQYPWYRVEAGNVTGWVYGRYVETPKEPSPAAPPSDEAGAGATAAAPPAPGRNGRVGHVTRADVRVRDGHSTRNTRVLTRLGNRDVTILESWQPEGAPYPWHRIRLDGGGEGWIYGMYVRLE